MKHFIFVFQGKEAVAEELIKFGIIPDEILPAYVLTSAYAKVESGTVILFEEKNLESARKARCVFKERLLPGAHNLSVKAEEGTFRASAPGELLAETYRWKRAAESAIYEATGVFAPCVFYKSEGQPVTILGNYNGTFDFSFEEWVENIEDICFTLDNTLMGFSM